MIRVFSLLFVFLALQFSTFTARSNPSDQFFLQHLDNRNGLSNSAINHIFQDSDNIVWVATWDGLNMFDGTSFHVFNYSKENDSKSIGSNIIQNISEDRRRNIWISTIEGISRYDKKSGKFYNYFYSQIQRGRISEQEYELAVDTGGNVFCMTKKYGLTYYDAAADTFRVCTSAPASFQKQPSARISKLIFDRSNHLWLLNNSGDLEMLSRNGASKFTIRRTYRDKSEILNFFYLNNRIFFTTATNQIFEIDPETLVQKSVKQLDRGITSMIYYKNHYLLAWSSKGYGVFDGQFRSSLFLNSEVQQMRDIKITSWALGSEQILWYGTDGNGIIKIFPKTKFFATVSTSDNGMPYNKSVRAFCEENGNLWVGTKGSGIIKIPQFWSETQGAKQHILSPAELDNNSVYVLKKGTDNLIYIGTDGKGLGVYDLLNKKFSKWANIKGFNKYAEFGSVYAILQDKDQSLWLGTSGYGLIHLKVTRDQNGKLSLDFLERYTFNNKNTGPANDIIYSLAEGDSNYLWVACRYGGLSLLDKKQRTFKTFKAFSYEGSLSNNDVLSLYKDKKNRIWVGTSYGLNWIDQKDAGLSKPIFKKLTTANGLPNNTIHAIEEDGAGYIWVSTNKGLAKVQPSDLEISRYQQLDGLQSNEFSDGAVWKDPAGYLYFGGTYGFNYFLPQNIIGSILRPNLLVSDIKLGGDKGVENSVVVLRPGINSSLNYSLNRKDNYFELQLKAVSYLNAEKCEYAYYLAGNDNEWHYSGTSGKVSYSNIPPGNYSLMVKWSNGEGLWTDEVKLLDLEVKQYFWLTLPALLVYFIILSATGYTIYSYRKNKLQIKHQLDMEHLLRQKEEDLHQEQLSFFTNITHELQTPLTLIMGSTERFLEKHKAEEKKQGRPYFLSLIHQQASRLSYLVQQLLEFRKAEAGYLKSQYSYLNVSELLDKLSSLFIPLAEQNSMLFKRTISPDIIAMIDKDKLEKIMFNLLSNAFKHSGKNENIFLKVEENKQTGMLQIEVANSGCHIPSDQLDKLFDKFYVSNIMGLEKFGAGIGLAFTRELVLVLNGEIKVSSENKWITFKVDIPLPVREKELKTEDKQQLTSNPSSFLYKSMVSYHEESTQSTVDNNKQAIILELETNKRQSILVVEDESAIRYLLKDILKDHYTIFESENGREALELIHKVIPDLIICDVMMPGMSGLELCNRVKNAPATCHIPFIILSARGNIEHRTEGYEVGADAYIAKPFHTAHLQVRIRKLLEYRKRLNDFFTNESAAYSVVESDLVDSDKQFLGRILSVIEKNLGEPDFNAARLESELAMSKMQLYRKLKTMTNLTPGEFIKHIRLKQAAHLLLSTNLTVSEIFYRTGFNNQSYFYREFKKRYQYAPNEYREQQNEQV
ncbi:hybrid sensor histidine kinase/response regulator transcription factor [Daejeonella oryzae]|uniref:hybrid sensor histidine kinase/response regulator transcription factor n=1 Tax=Daejeonella oryzae TaxID=1122943 RepID=UPI00040949D4|nr:hybrid sensor histidine kinase/response regulator transcription factor [Daejeonella oryzae]